MPNWGDILNEIKTAGSTQDIIRRKYLLELSNYTERNVIIYYSGWLQKPGLMGAGINDNDKIGFMSTIHGLDREKGLDLILHTPGGGTAATESLVDYLRRMFGTNIRAIVPQIALSAGTMIACACKSIILGKHSSLGPIDPQIQGLPAHGIIEEFNQAFQEIKQDPAKVPVWQPIIAKYNPTLIGEAQKAIDWSTEMVCEWLSTGMLSEESDPVKIAKQIVHDIGDHALTKSHDRHLSIEKCREIGLKVIALEDDQKLQDKVLSVHHSCILTLDQTPAFKLIENQNGIAYIQQIPTRIMQSVPNNR